MDVTVIPVGSDFIVVTQGQVVRAIYFLIEQNIVHGLLNNRIGSEAEFPKPRSPLIGGQDFLKCGVVGRVKIDDYPRFLHAVPQIQTVYPDTRRVHSECDH